MISLQHAVLAFAIAVACANATAAGNAKPGAANPVAPTTPTTVRSAASGVIPVPANLGPVTQSAAGSGVRRCLARIDQVVNFVSAGTQSGAMVFAPPTDTDNRQSSVVLEVLGNNGLSYVDTAFSPHANGCVSMYQAVTYWTNACAEVAKTAFPNFVLTSPLRQHITVLDGGPSAKVFLIPAGPGCVSVKKEVLY